MNPLILLYGPPGTGKTSLCQGLAQKISIRLNSTYKQTKLVQVKTATLLSKYYSESAKQVDQIFTTIGEMCQNEPEEFICVVIDEVESIASSRESVISQGESQDSLRATNALLTGVDRTRNYPNLIYLCTSNMFESLDSAFLDRCGVKRAVGPPTLASQYEILRRRMQHLISSKIIKSDEILPSYHDALISSLAGEETPGTKLRDVITLIHDGNMHMKPGNEISGRALTQLPEQAVLRYLREEECDLDTALKFLKRFVVSEQEQRKQKQEDETSSGNAAQRVAGVEIRGQKRTLKIILEEDSTIEKLEEVLAELRRKNQQEDGIIKTEGDERLS